MESLCLTNNAGFPGKGFPAREKRALLLLWIPLFLSGCLGPVSRGPRSTLPRAEPPRVVLSVPHKRSSDLTSPRPMFSPPLQKFRVRSRYGLRGGKWHRGVDLVGSPKGGDPVLASMAGTVQTVSHRGNYGRMVVLRHGDTGFTRYAHLQKAIVRPGESIQQGQTIGFVGKSGRATGYHLHFEVLTAEQKTLDPMPYLFPSKKSFHLVSPPAAPVPSSVNLNQPNLPTIPVTQNVK
jgi:murein DD-endopeptidase MepM/ murein hydrolase activator NlpD